MDYYTTSSEAASEVTIQFNGKKDHHEKRRKDDSHDSNESGFDERRDSSSSQEQLEKVDPNAIYNQVIKKAEKTSNQSEHKDGKNESTHVESKYDEGEAKIPVPPVMPPLPVQMENVNDKNDNSITAEAFNTKLVDLDMKNEIKKYIDSKENNARHYDSAQNIANTETQFYEEEFSYEPELKRTSSKLVLRTRSLLNLDEETNANNKTFVVRPTAVRTKITTGPDGTFVIDGRKATSELNLSDESASSSKSGSPKTCRPSGEDLKRRKEEIFKPKCESKSSNDINKYNEEINKDNPQTTKQMAINNLKMYLKENKIGLKELLTNKNVVIIEPYREDKPADISEYNHKNADFDKGCRITGATVKSGSVGDISESASNTLPRAAKPHQPNVQRHYFYHLIKTKGDLKDEELPDPDKVRNTRQMFQKEVKLTGPEDAEIMLPIAAKIVNPSKESKPRLTPEVRIIDDGKRRPPFDKKLQNKKWTDTGSLSSGVSSDMSCFENELDNNLDEISHKGYSSDDELEPEAFRETTEIHPVSQEFMKKIRACGTTVTYYGGRVISHSDGPVRSPMTMTIMDEIRQGNESSRRLRDQYLGVKFRLVKSNSCGSRLELAGTEDQHHHEPSKNRYYEEVFGKSICEELAECRGRMEPIEDVEDVQANIKVSQVQSIFENKEFKDKKKPIQSWRVLIESRKQNKAMELRRNCPDMVFEEFQVAGN
ncbi:uncharacterized protein LOC106671047 [Cimex lectularius]|uniref:Uncharacterized protein n=1 Tax=Cimex lectularius TaxID=79782 RepID=A0A8I6TGV8_CIMLE|nr:uncharacterized protein LOC106671047 [Cimex lectularius]XP_014257294.1 uncharacterized protein LOC106671047 [Cimex lectularius]